MMSVTHRPTVQALVVQQVLLKDRLLTGQLLLGHLLQTHTVFLQPFTKTFHIQL